ncbi:MAG TPA: hypothetical protein VMM82_07550, partial [Spirochaetia bacterium]|nr:hypothetical protein [Spirochaetia bacterium]
MKARKRAERPAARRGVNPPRTHPTIAFVGLDPLGFETVRASLAGGPFLLVRCAERPADGQADLLVVPA